MVFSENEAELTISPRNGMARAMGNATQDKFWRQVWAAKYRVYEGLENSRIDRTNPPPDIIGNYLFIYYVVAGYWDTGYST